MNTKDKAREKLLSSMRKTKAVINDQPDSKQAHAETYAPAAAKSTAKPTPKTASARSEKVTTLPDEPPIPNPAGYQSHGRVWPD